MSAPSIRRSGIRMSDAAVAAIDRGWMSGEPFVVQEGHLKLNWGDRGREDFCCGWCLTPFEVGETARWVYVNGATNTFVCVQHDGPDVVERWVNQWRDTILPILRRFGDR